MGTEEILGVVVGSLVDLRLSTRKRNDQGVGSCVGPCMHASVSQTTRVDSRRTVRVWEKVPLRQS